MPRSSIKDEKVYKEVRKDGASKEKAARIANSAANRGRSGIGRNGRKSSSYQDWTVDELEKSAKEVGLSGYCDDRNLFRLASVAPVSPFQRDGSCVHIRRRPRRGVRPARLPVSPEGRG